MTGRVAIIGAGPSGLSAAYELVRHGIRPTVLECSDRVGGLMASVTHGDCTVDLGRKELYARIPEVSEMWQALLGDDYIAYPHRVGSLYGGRIIELSGQFRGPLRGVPLPLLVTGGLSLIGGRVRSLFLSPRNFEEYWEHRVGRVFSRVFARGYWEKFRGARWHSMPVPTELTGGHDVSHSQKVIGRTLGLARRRTATPGMAWKHPRFGTGQLFDCLREEIDAAGVQICFRTTVSRINLDRAGAWHLEVSSPGGTSTVVADYVISGLSLEGVASALNVDNQPVFPSDKANASRGVMEKRHVVLVYLFSNTPPRFSHAWLEVNDPGLRSGRITNYTGFGGAMVPEGKTCLCVEFFCSEGDDLLAEDDAALVRRALADCAVARLFDPEELVDSRVIRLARTNAAASWREQQSQERREIYTRLRALDTFYHVNRPGSDWASFAGLLAAQAIAHDDRTDFDNRADPTQRLPERHA